MNAEQLELLRIDICRVLDANEAQWGINLNVITVHLHPYGFDVERPFLLKELAYLGDKGFIAIPSKAVSPENKTWRITAAGRDFLAQFG
jgi:hypothetical protein